MQRHDHGGLKPSVHAACELLDTSHTSLSTETDGTSSSSHEESSSTHKVSNSCCFCFHSATNGGKRSVSERWMLCTVTPAASCSTLIVPSVTFPRSSTPYTFSYSCDLSLVICSQSPKSPLGGPEVWACKKKTGCSICSPSHRPSPSITLF
ncbi:hypothetical protein EYF80_035817 [Liparis tanakae]|uniref:Uncharacterized protein n=1 Tax=Liparis tanakae TaxID=230148 RepID=A0A4Z2GMG6_9TELE|nr:hypothetical protein EYF80_035817 [Liparis tanakae]